MDGLLDTGDKVASVVGALAGVVAVLITVSGVRRRRRTPPALTGAALMGLLRAQEHDAARHRYRFFGHVPALSEVYVRQQVADPGTAELAVGVDAMVTGERHAILLGGAGAGKSALVAAVVAAGAGAALSGRHRKVFTVAVAAADLVGQSLSGALAQACLHDLKVELGAATFDEPPVPGGRWRIMIDGIDEIIDPDVRSRLLWSLHSLLGEPATTRQLVITSRPLQEYEMAELRQANVDVFELQPFDREELDSFAQRWFEARDPGRPEVTTALAVRFVARVAGARLGPVARVPLLSTIAAMIFERDSERPLPSSRAALYEKFVDHLLTGRHELRHTQEAIDAALADRGANAARQLAAWLRADFPAVIDAILNTVGDAQVRDPQFDMVDTATAWLRRHSGHDMEAVVPNGRQLIRDLLLATGVVDYQGRRLRFIHQSFAEFFAARHRAPDFAEGEWRTLMANPGARSLAGFMVATRPDSDRLIAGLLDGGFDPVAAGDLLADGIPVHADTRRRVIDALVAETSSGTEGSDSLRVLRELSVDADVVRRLSDLAADEAANEWTRVVVAAAVAEVDRATGVRLLREAASQLADPAARALADRSLFAYGAAPRPVEWEAGRAGERGPLGVFGRQALAERATDPRFDDEERVDAAIRLADDGEAGALRGLLETPGINNSDRLRAAAALADRGDDNALLALAGGSANADYYVASSATNHSLQFRALLDLHRRGHPSAVGLLTAFAASTSAPCTFGAAAMLSDLGHFDALIDLAAAPRGPSQLAEAAARRLVLTADPAKLHRAALRTVLPKPRIWVAAGLVRPGHPDQVPHLLRPGLISADARTELYAILAARGDAQARRRLHGQATWVRRPRLRRRAVIALAALGDPGVLATLRRRARSSRRARTRLHAAAALGRWGTDQGWHTLRELAASAKPRLRLLASARLAYETGDLDPLLALITDDGVPVRHRVRAADILGRSVDRAARNLTWEVREEHPRFGPRIRLEEARHAHPPYGMQLLIESSVGVWRRLPTRHSARLEALVRTPTTHARLLLAIADAGLPREQTLDLLVLIAQDPRHSRWNRVRAARTLLVSADPRGDQTMRTFAGDRDFPRLLRWWILLRWGWAGDWEEFTAHFQRYLSLDEGSRVLRIPRLGMLLLTRPDPAETNR